MKPPNVSADLLDVPLCNLPLLARDLVCRLEESGYHTIGDCLNGWSILATCEGTWRTRHPMAPKNVGRAFLRQLAESFAACELSGLPDGDWREDDPTPSEIRARAAAVRETWDRQRWRAYAPRRVKVQVVRDPRGDYECS